MYAGARERTCVCMHVYVCLHVCLGEGCKVHHYISILENSMTNIVRKSENILYGKREQFCVPNGPFAGVSALGSIYIKTHNPILSM